MQRTNRSYLIQSLVLGFVLIVCVIVFANRTRTYPLTPNNTVHFANPGILSDWTTEHIRDTALQHIEFYLAVNNDPGSELTITGAPRYGNDGSLSFEFTTDQAATVYTATVETSDYGGGIVSSAVVVNGDSTAYTASERLYDTQFSGFESLLDKGLSGIQVYGIEKQLLRFDPNNTYTVQRGGIRQTTLGGTVTTTIQLRTTKGSYRLQNYSAGINNLRVVLYNDTKQVFDSGQVTIAN